MKKILLSLGVMLTSITLNAQVDTLSEFFTGTPTIYGVATADGGGYLTGNNGYADVNKMMKFDASTGVTNGGFITDVLLWAPIKNDNGGSFKVKVWSYVDATTLGTELGSVTVNLADLDTSFMAYQFVGTTVYNFTASFTNPIAIPASEEFVVGVELPSTSGDTLVLISNTDGDFSLCATNSFEVWSDQTFSDLNTSWQGLNIAMGIFPVVNFVAGVDEKSALSAKTYPNPATDVLNIQLNTNASSVSILGLDGKVISTEKVNSNDVSVNVANLVSGMYVYEVTSASGEVIRNSFVKK
jgi:hypothetical protein